MQKLATVKSKVHLNRRLDCWKELVMVKCKIDLLLIFSCMRNLEI